MEFQASAVGQLGHDIGILHSDNGGECISGDFKLYMILILLPLLSVHWWW